MTEAWRQGWTSHWRADIYGQLLFKRATGDLPEMESSKAVAARLKNVLKSGDLLLDVGCGAGHYLRSLNAAITVPYDYTGLDATPGYVELARKAFAGRPQVKFKADDIYNLGEGDESHDVVMCNNLLLHLPSIAQPLRELCRVGRRFVLIRTLVGDSSFRIQEVLKEKDGHESFDERGQPNLFHYFNIYGRDYVLHLLRSDPRVKSVKIIDDLEYDQQAIAKQEGYTPGNPNVTRVIDGRQVSGYILCPWSFVEIELQPRQGT